MTAPGVDRRMIEIRDLIGAIIHDASPPPAPPPPRFACGAPVSAVQLRALQSCRKARATFLPAPLFGEPGWDMLIDLAAATLEGRPVSTSSLCLAAMVPQTTALRHVEKLLDLGILHRRADPVDGRRIFLDLDDRARDAMLGWAGKAFARLAAFQRERQASGAVE